MVKQEVVIGVLMHVESGSALSYRRILLLHGVLASFCTNSWRILLVFHNMPRFWVKLDN